ncbi:hypothetical protein [Enterococcus crotali]|nr:hypothetical protein [Enterococcus crotali]
MNNANSVFNNEEATQEQVNKAKTDLQTAFDNLEEKLTGGSLSATEVQ